ncbi:MAG: divalent-cation tolerance protein CutA [Magnetococcales bacterium]|nr:divalent-cation tolerance protein CutA [Magnetococcales bacterium]
MDMILLWTTVPEKSVATTLSETLVEEGLAACVHVLPAGESCYRWQGEIQRQTEWTLLIKSRQSLYPLLEARLLALHPYEVPELVATPVSQTLPAYWAWLVASTREPSVGEA